MYVCVCLCLVNSRNVKHHLSISSNSVAVSHSQVITTVHFQNVLLLSSVNLRLMVNFQFTPEEPGSGW